MPEDTNIKYSVEGLADIRAATATIQKLSAQHQALAQSLKKIGVTAPLTQTISQAVGQGQKLTTTVKGTAAGITSVNQRLTQTSKNLGTVNKSTQQVNKATQGVLISWRSVVRVIAGTIVSRSISRLALAFSGASRDAIEFSIRIGELRSISLNAAVATEVWRDELLKLASTFALQPLDVVEGAYQALSNQVVEGAEAIIFMEEAARLAILTVSDITTAVEALTGIMKAYNLNVSEAASITNLLHKSVEIGRFRLDEIGNTLGRVNILASQLGLTVAEVQAALDVLTVKGINVNEAMSGMRILMLKLIRPGEEMKQIFKELHVATGQQAIETFGLIGFFEKLIERAGPARQILQEMGDAFQRVRAVSTAVGLAGNLKETSQALDELINKAEDANQALFEITDTAGFKTKQSFTTLSNAVLKFGQDMLEIMQDVNRSLVVLAPAISALGDNIGKVASVVGLLLAHKLAFRLAAIAVQAGILNVGIFGLQISFATLAAKIKLASVSLLAFAAHPVTIAAGFAFLGFKIGEGIATALDRSSKKLQEFTEEEVSRMELAALRMSNAWITAFNNITKAHKQSVDAQVRKQLQANSAAGAAIQKQLDTANLRRDIEKEIFDLQLDLAGSANNKLLLIDKRFKALKTDLLSFIQAGDFESAFDIKSELESLISAAESVINTAKGASKQATADLTARAGDIITLRGSARGVIPLQSVTRELETQTIKQTNILNKYKQEILNITSVQALEAQLKQLQKEREGIEQGADNFSKALTDYEKAFAEGADQRAKSAVIIDEALQKALPALQGLNNAFGELLTLKLNPFSKESTEAFNARIDAGKEITGILGELDALGKEGLAQIGPEKLEAFVQRLEAANAIFKSQAVTDFTNILKTSTGFLKNAQDTINQSKQNLENIGATIENLSQANTNLSGTLNNVTSTAEAAANATANAFTSAEGTLNRFVANWEAAIARVRASAAEETAWRGGYVRKAHGGSIATDNIPALLSPGEFVLNARTARRFLPQITAANSNALKFGGNVTNNRIGDINVTVEGGSTPDISARKIGVALRRELIRGNIRL
jgi:TP901 family phage tail tape measure protein